MDNLLNFATSQILSNPQWGKEAPKRGCSLTNVATINNANRMKKKEDVEQRSLSVTSCKAYGSRQGPRGGGVSGRDRVR
jgi:hypothetical protein